MGPQTGTEDNLPKEDAGGSEDELPRIPAGVFMGGGGRGDEVGSSEEEADEGVEGGAVQVGGYQLLDANLNAPGNGDDDSEEDSSDDDDDDDDDGETVANDLSSNFGWARFDEMLPSGNSDPDATWPNADSEESSAPLPPPLTTDSFALPPSPQSEDSSFLAGGRRPVETTDSSTRNMGKVDDIRQAMAKITLPKAAVPDWANQLSEEDWRKALDERLNLTKK